MRSLTSSFTHKQTSITRASNLSGIEPKTESFNHIRNHIKRFARHKDAAHAMLTRRDVAINVWSFAGLYLQLVSDSAHIQNGEKSHIHTYIHWPGRRHKSCGHWVRLCLPSYRQCTRLTNTDRAAHPLFPPTKRTGRRPQIRWPHQATQRSGRMSMEGWLRRIFGKVYMFGGGLWWTATIMGIVLCVRWMNWMSVHSCSYFIYKRTIVSHERFLEMRGL